MQARRPTYIQRGRSYMKSKRRVYSPKQLDVLKEMPWGQAFTYNGKAYRMWGKYESENGLELVLTVEKEQNGIVKPTLEVMKATELLMGANSQVEVKRIPKDPEKWARYIMGLPENSEQYTKAWKQWSLIFHADKLTKYEPKVKEICKDTFVRLTNLKNIKTKQSNKKIYEIDTHLERVQEISSFKISIRL